eukprot:NODE_138_length_1411_cov_252.784875_g108_i0.p1 GENE.NODE_138_length_1411_cov_252.784875_g108_i0~~NODE_138_length_1411_cov_252.784875_g108_i0.p1  ORF type:complete len:230 (+),score=57.73 NODE_138_length_1411_cov_252.784875_g108_i0:172-861(+)
MFWCLGKKNGVCQGATCTKTGKQKWTYKKSQEGDEGCPTTMETDCSGPCPPKDGDGEWAPWGDCDHCKGDVQTRTKECSTPPQDGGKECATKEWRACPCHLHNNCRGHWKSWGACSKSCGGGEQKRVYKVDEVKRANGTDCPYQDGKEQTKKCNAQPCDIPCQGSWSAWGPKCSTKCHEQKRTFTVSQKEEGNGKGCVAEDGDTEVRSCPTNRESDAAGETMTAPPMMP